MIHCVYGHDEVIAQFVAQLIPSCRERGFSKAMKAIGVVNDRTLVAGFVYHNWEPDAGVIEISCAALPGSRWLTRRTIFDLYAYPFLQCECQMVVGRVDAENEQLLRQMAALNYSMIRVPRMLGRDHDGVLCLLTVEDWMNNKLNRPRTVEAQKLNEAA